MKVLDIINESTSWTDAFPSVTAWMKKNERRRARNERIIMGRWGSKVLVFLKVLMIAGPCLEFSLRVMALEDIAGLPDDEYTRVTGEPASEKSVWVEKSRNMMWGLFSVQILLPIIYAGVKRISFITPILTILAGFAGVGLTKSAAGFMVGARVIEQSAIALLVNWLGTKEGADWLSKSFFGPFLMPVGAVGSYAWDFISENFFKVTGITPPEKSNVAKEIEKNSTPKYPRPTDDEIRAADAARWATTKPGLFETKQKTL
jgi:hypothetical protein